MKRISKKPQFSVLKLFGAFLALILAGGVFVHAQKKVFGFSSDAGTFKRLDFQSAKPGNVYSDDHGKFFLSFDTNVSAKLIKDSGIPLFYVDILGARIEANPFLLNFPHGPAKMVRLNQISDSPMVIRATFFLRRNLVPTVSKVRNGLEITFATEDMENENPRESFSLIPPLAKSVVTAEPAAVSKPKAKTSKEKMRIKIRRTDPSSLFRELARQMGQVIHFRDPMIKEVEIDVFAENAEDAMEKIANKLGLIMSQEDGDIWISSAENPILKVSENFKVEGVNLTNLALGDVLRALGQIAEINIVLDASLKDLQMKPVQMFLKKMSVRRALETLLKVNHLVLDEIDESSLLVLTQKSARAMEGKVVRVISPKVPLETMKALIEKSAELRMKDRYVIQEDLGNLVLVGDKEAVDSIQTLISSVENKILTAGEGSSRKYFQPVNTKPKDLIALAKDSISSNENLKITHDERTDTILLMGAEESTKRALALMKKIDKPRTKQALIHIRLIEIHRTDLEEIGIKLPSALASTNDIGRLNSANYVIPAELVGYLEKSKIKTLANPTIRCMDKEESTIDISEQIPVKNTVTEFLPVASSSLAARTSDNWTTSEVGIKMNITPLIHINNEISMEVDIDQTELVSLVEGHPWTAKRSIKTKVRVKDRETVVIGGLIRTKKEKVRRPVPFLSRIPFLNKLLRNVEHRNNKDEKTEMVILITPSVVGVGVEENANFSMLDK